MRCAAARVLRERLAGAVTEADGDVKVLTAALRETFEAFALSRLPDERNVIASALLEEEMEWLLEPSADGRVLSS